MSHNAQQQKLFDEFGSLVTAAQLLSDEEPHTGATIEVREEWYGRALRAYVSDHR